MSPIRGIALRLLPCLRRPVPALLLPLCVGLTLAGCTDVIEIAVQRPIAVQPGAIIPPRATPTFGTVKIALPAAAMPALTDQVRLLIRGPQEYRWTATLQRQPQALTVSDVPTGPAVLLAVAFDRQMQPLAATTSDLVVRAGEETAVVVPAESNAGLEAAVAALGPTVRPLPRTSPSPL